MLGGLPERVRGISGRIYVSHCIWSMVKAAGVQALKVDHSLEEIQEGLSQTCILKTQYVFYRRK
jgi:hypothetical protein